MSFLAGVAGAKTTVALVLEAVIAALKFPEELSKFIKLVSKSPEEKRLEINAQVDAWLKDSATAEKPGEEVEDPKWEV